MNQLFPIAYEFTQKLWKSCQTLYFETPLTAKSWPPTKKFFRHTVLNYFLGKAPTHNNVAPKLNAWGQKIGLKKNLVRYKCLNVTLCIFLTR